MVIEIRITVALGEGIDWGGAQETSEGEGNALYLDRSMSYISICIYQN